MSWEIKKYLKQQLAGEKGYYIYPAGTRTRFALAYPNSYFVGMSNLGMHIIYRLLNERNDTACERFFLPEKKMQENYEKTIPFTLDQNHIDQPQSESAYPGSAC